MRADEDNTMSLVLAAGYT